MSQSTIIAAIIQLLWENKSTSLSMSQIVAALAGSYSPADIQAAVLKASSKGAIKCNVNTSNELIYSFQRNMVAQNIQNKQYGIPAFVNAPVNRILVLQGLENVQKNTQGSGFKCS